MRIIGVTGGIGSGKSTVSRILSDLGAKIVDADVIARKAVGKGEKALAELVASFGEGILSEQGELNRKKLADIVFANESYLELLNKITHKYIAEHIINEVNKVKAQGEYETIVIDAPIPVEHGFLNMVDRVWVVTADSDIRIKRIMSRNGITFEEAEARINSQRRDEEYLRIADETIFNNGDIEELEQAVVKLYYAPAE